MTSPREQPFGNFPDTHLEYPPGSLSVGTVLELREGTPPAPTRFLLPPSRENMFNNVYTTKF